MRLLVALLCLLVAWPAYAVDDAQRNKARAHVKKARAAYEAGDYDKAVAEYKAAYKIVGNPEILFNVGQVMRAKDDKPNAIAIYRRYLSDAPEGKNVEEARAQIAALVRAQVPEPLHERWDKAREAAAGKLDEKWAALEEKMGRGDVANAEEELSAIEDELAKLRKPKPKIEPRTEQAAVEQVAKPRERKPFVPNPIVRKWWFWTAIGGGAVVVLAIGLGAGLGGAKDPTPTLGTLQ
jgi:tetratricopeptide (TPR) repeat protein